MNDVQSFKFMRSFAVAMEELNDKQKKDFLLAIINYVFYDESPEFKGKLKLAWILVEPILTKSKHNSHPKENE